MLIGPAQRLRLPQLLDRHLGKHGHHQGLSNGCPATVWLTHILSEGDHRKSGVEDRAWRRRRTLEGLVGPPTRRVACNDDRLGIIFLRHLSRTSAWEALGTDLWQSTPVVYEIEVTDVRPDSTTTYGYHSPRGRRAATRASQRPP